MKLPKAYEPNSYEPNIYALWEQGGVFEPKGDGEPYAIAIPPPNANGNLHVGHALMVPLEDILIRYHRLRGWRTIFIPGADHAGFETWVVYERELANKQKSRFEYSREELYSQVWDFVEAHRGNMEIQLRELGASLSWKNLVFTLDAKVIKTTFQTFKQMWDDGLIYRGERIVNFCTVHQTSFADIEVEHKDEKATLWRVAYPLSDRIGEIVVATTRPETILGDTAIAVNPSDERYKDLIGHKAIVPLTDREVPIIADEVVDPKFGTGAVKVTPAHDPVDFDIGKRHNLTPIQVIGFDGHITSNAPPQFIGLNIEEARKRILAALEAAEFRRGEEEITHSVGHCYKCGSVIQPLIKDQWFVKVAPLAERAVAALEAGEIKFTPESKLKALLQYYKNLKDWNISRQIPWGIPIPAFQNVDNPEEWIFDDRVDQTTITVNGQTYRREEDTFDTWFSSGQWPYIVTDFLAKGELSEFYPLSLMETGHDILYPWVSRMIMLGLYRTGQVPFKEVYLHGLILDEHGQKMSKSKGNVINPQQFVAEYGSDALRMGIVANRSAGQNQAFSIPKVIAARNFCNKLWNIARYIEDRVGDDFKSRQPKAETLADHWVIRELNQASDEIERSLKNYRFAEAVETIYHTLWDKVADWYIEASKLQTNADMLAWVLQTILKIAHPFAPFVTETIWQTLKWETGLLASSTWPPRAEFNEISAAEFDQLQSLVSEIRFVASELGQGKATVIYQNDQLIADNADLIAALARLEALEAADQPQGLKLAVPNREAWLKADPDVVYEHQSRLETRLAGTREQINHLRQRLDNPSYTEKAPAEVVEDTRKQLAESEKLAERLSAELDVLQ